MNIHVFSVRDIKVGSFNRPFFAQSKGSAIRSFHDEVRRDAPDNVMHVHPEDFELFYLGVFDDEQGNFPELVSPPFLLSRAVEALQPV